MIIINIFHQLKRFGKCFTKFNTWLLIDIENIVVSIIKELFVLFSLFDEVFQLLTVAQMLNQNVINC